MFVYNLISLVCTRDENAATAPWIANSFPIIKIVLLCLLAICSIAMIVFVVMQKSNTNGVTAISGQSDTFYNRNKGATLQGKIKTLTIIDAILIMVFCIVFLILNTIYPAS